jgi:hypothetical protein
MKKLFVSVPMKSRTEEEIKYSITKMHRIAEAYEDEELELIDSWVAEAPPADCNRSVWYLSKSIEKLAEADIFIGVSDLSGWPGCKIESDVAKAYGIKSYSVDTKIVVDYGPIVQRAFLNATYNTINEERNNLND